LYREIPIMKHYLAGQMTGIAQFNFPRFREVANKLRTVGFEIVNPAEIDNPADEAESMASVDGAVDSVTKTWGEFLGRDVQIVADEVDGVILMDEWYKSKGARLEAYTGILADKAFHTYTNHGLFPIDSRVVLSLLVTHTEVA